MTQMVTERFHFEGWPDAVPMVDGDVLDLGGVTVQLLHAPGHTAGHSVYLVEGDVRVVVTGDIDLSTFGPYYGDAVSSLDAFEATLSMVRDVRADHYATFHHKGVIDGHDAFVAAVDAYAAVFVRREQTLLDLLSSPRTFDELVDSGIVYRAGTRPPIFGESVERRSIEQHLQRAVADGVVLTDGHQYWRAMNESDFEFDRSTAVVDGDGAIHDGWDIGGNANGGYLMALAAQGLRNLAGRPDPISMTGHYLSPGRPGPVRVDGEVVKQGRRFSTVAGRMHRDEHAHPAGGRLVR